MGSRPVTFTGCVPTNRSAVSMNCCPGTGASQPPFTPLRLRKALLLLPSSAKDCGLTASIVA
jgi:hypothetical protein